MLYPENVYEIVKEYAVPNPLLNVSGERLPLSWRMDEEFIRDLMVDCEGMSPTEALEVVCEMADIDTLGVVMILELTAKEVAMSPLGVYLTMIEEGVHEARLGDEAMFMGKKVAVWKMHSWELMGEIYDLIRNKDFHPVAAVEKVSESWALSYGFVIALLDRAVRLSIE